MTEPILDDTADDVPEIPLADLPDDVPDGDAADDKV